MLVGLGTVLRLPVSPRLMGSDVIAHTERKKVKNLLIISITMSRPTFWSADTGTSGRLN